MDSFSVMMSTSAIAISLVQDEIVLQTSQKRITLLISPFRTAQLEPVFLR